MNKYENKDINSKNNNILYNIKLQKKSNIWKLCVVLFLVVYIVFTLLHRFVIPQNIIVLSDSDLLQKVLSDNAVITENSYIDENISIEIETIREFDTDIYIAEILISESFYLKTGLANNSFGKNVKEKTSEIAEYYGAILAINGDYYGFRDYGYVMRNGYLYRDDITSDETEALVIYQDGNMEIINESLNTVEELEDNGAYQILSFGPGLISNGEILVDHNSEVEGEDERNPRTAIAMISENHYIFMVADGRTNESNGLSLEEMAIVLNQYDCEVAYNLDGGGSSTMVFMGEIINNPTTNGKDIKERSVSDIVYIG